MNKGKRNRKTREIRFEARKISDKYWTKIRLQTTKHHWEIVRGEKRRIDSPRNLKRESTFAQTETIRDETKDTKNEHETNYFR
jgi:hypothetical protein